MNKFLTMLNTPYCRSLGSFLTLNTAVWVTLNLLLGNPFTFVGFVITTALAIAIHRFFLFEG